LIENSIFHNAFDGVKVRKGRDVRIIGNLFEGLGLGGSSCGGDDQGNVSDVLYERNVFIRTHDSLNIREQSGGGHGAFNIVARNNLFLERMTGSPAGNGGSYASVGSDTVRNVHWHHNLWYNITMEHDFSMGNAAPEGASVASNIFVKETDNYLYSNNAVCFSISSAGAVPFLNVSHNLYSTTAQVSDVWTVGGTDYATLQALQGVYATLESQSKVGQDPLLQDPASRDFRPKVGSPAIDAGLNPLPAAPGRLPSMTHDFWKNARSAPFDIGPFEYSSAAPTSQSCAQLDGYLCGGRTAICPENLVYPNANEAAACCMVPCQECWMRGVDRTCGHGCSGADPAVGVPACTPQLSTTAPSSPPTTTTFSTAAAVSRATRTPVAPLCIGLVALLLFAATL
jgi:hypothetical protein